MRKVLVLTIFLFSLRLTAQTLVQTVSLPAGDFYKSGYGLVYYNQLYWVSSENSTTGSGIIRAVDKNGTEAAVITISGTGYKASQGLATEENSFWYVERGTSTFRLIKFSHDGTVTKTLNGPSGKYLGGAAWDGSGLWLSVYYPNADAGLVKIDVNTGSIVDNISTVRFGTQPTGITIKGDTLFFVMDGFDSQQERIYALSLTTKDTLFSFKTPELPGVRQNPRGLAWDGSHLWLLAEPVGQSSGRQLFKYALGGGSPNINLITKQIDFGNVQISSVSNAGIYLQNYGSANLRIDSVKVSDPDFTVGSTFPVIVTPNNSTTLPVSFRPMSNKAYKDSILIYHNDINFRYSRVKLTGTGIYTASYIGFSDTLLDFGQKRRMSTSCLTLEIKNEGSARLKIDSMTLNKGTFYFTENYPRPLYIDSISSYKIKVWFKPELMGSYMGTLTLYSNASNGAVRKITLSGDGVSFDATLGSIVWEGHIPDNPYTTYQDYSAKSIKKMDDINGDGIDDILIASDNYLLTAFNGNSSGNSDILWIHNTGIDDNNTGSVYMVQAMQVSEDLNNDGHRDVVIGTAGGSESVIAIDGKTGLSIWEFGDPVTYTTGDIMGVDVKRDFNNDGTPDVLATASGDENSGSGRFSVYCLNGKTGAVIWRIDQSAQKKLKYAVVSTDFGGAAGSRVNTQNEVIGFDKPGNIVWTYPTANSPWALCEIPNIGGGTSSDVLVGEMALSTTKLYALSGDNGELLWEKPLPSAVGDIRIIPDMNNNGTPDIMVHIYSSVFNVLEGKNGEPIITSYTTKNNLGIAQLGDLNADGLPELGVTSLDNKVYVFNSQNGSSMFQYAFGSGTNDLAAELISDMDDVDGNFSSEFVAASRDGRVICFSGGTSSVPVEMRTFTAKADNSCVMLNWTTATEVNNRGFEIYRDGQIIGFIQGRGTTSELQTYSYFDKSVPMGKHVYRLVQIDLDGKKKESGRVEVEVNSLPQKYALYQNYPNPFNPATVIKYDLPFESRVNITVFNSIGQMVQVLQDEVKPAGSQEVLFNAHGLSSGTYIYVIEAKASTGSETFRAVKKMVMLK